MLKIDRNDEDPIYLQIYRQFREQIILGQLKTGERLPATRMLSEEYHLSRNTILSAYQQLESEGFIRSTIGSGFYVEELPSFSLNTEEKSPPQKKMSKEGHYMYDFRYGALEPNLYRNTGFRRCLKEAMNELENRESLSNADPGGVYGLRQAISDYLYEVRDMQVSPEQVFITGGHHYSISLLQKLLPEEIHTLYMEDPGHEDSSDIFMQAGYVIKPVRVDDNGMIIDQIGKEENAIAYVTPSHQFPLGAILPIGRRLQLLRWAKEYHNYIIEDDYDAELRYREQPIPSLYSLDRGESVIYLGSFSKSLSPDLRISYVVLPSDLDYEKISRQILISSPASALIQLTIERFIRSGLYRSRIAKIRNLLRKKHNRIISFFHENYENRIILYGIGGGTHFVLSLPTERSQEEILAHFHERDIAVYPTKDYFHDQDKAPENMILIGYSGIPLQKLEEYLLHIKQSIDTLI